ncbi:hypothetical protein [Promicromonospora sp. NPDC050880]|uniref:hypothetical protein n=1 Tax=Promicromonospora sp. NPDC050880 TaxID=3364406 RepID=UPI0037AEB710
MRLGLGGRGVWWAWSAGFVAFSAIEVLVLHLIGGALLPRPAALKLDVVIGVITLALLVAFVSPLWSVHTVADDGTARLRFGLLGSIAVHPRDVARARSFTPTATRPAEAGVGLDQETGRVTLIRSPGSPLVLATFARPIPARVQLFRRVLAAECVVGTDDAHRLVAALVDRPRA